MTTARALRSLVCTAVALGLGGAAAPATAQAPPRAPTSIAVGDAALTPVLDLRLRGEFRHDPPDMGGVEPITGAVTPRVRGAFAGLERARLGADVEGGALRARIVLEDARLLGTSGADGLFGPYEAWLEAHSSAPKRFYLRAGRQSVHWGEGLLVGAADFAPVGRALDAVRGRATFGVVEIEALAALLTATRPSSPDFGFAQGPFASGAQLYGVRGAWAIDPLLKLELFTLARIARTGEGGSDFARARGEGESYTASLRASGDSAGIAYGAEAAAQLGRVERLAPSSTSRAAWAAFAHVGKTFESVPLVPSARLGGSYASGDGGSGGTHTQFDPILPDVHAHFGAMNAFAWSNTIQAHARGGIVPWSDAQLFVEYRYVRLADERGEWLNGNLFAIGRATPNDSAELGHEIDVLLSYAPWPAFDLRAGYAATLWGDGARTILARAARGSYDPAYNAWVPSDTAHYAYLQARVRFP